MLESAQGGLRSLAPRDDDLFIGYDGAIAGGEYTGHGRRATRIHLDLAARRELHGAFKPVGIRHEPDLHKYGVCGAPLSLSL